MGTYLLFNSAPHHGAVSRVIKHHTMGTHLLFNSAPYH